MIEYAVSIHDAHKQYIRFQATIESNTDTTILQLPVWRPGRYELGNFAKNIKSFKVFDSNNKPLSFRKINASKWEIMNGKERQFRFEYQYYANELNAGSSFLNKKRLYVNPVNCFMYPEEQFESEVTVSLDLPKDWEIACALPQNENRISAKNFDHLFDSPFICSSQLQHESYENHGINFHIWFNGEVKPEWERLIKDFKAFTNAQLEKFSEFPGPEYHFFIQVVPYKMYHGVEHLHSTVLALGPSYAIFKELYKELLGVASHELYHAWNVKAIRPVEMYPYDFTKENFSQLGYLSEGVTTYMGDLFLLKSKVFTLDQYLLEFKAQLQKHFDNFGRFNYSVAQSSFDTWLDGYAPGAPGRKVSIYTEGCLIAFVLDTMILKATNEKYGLDEVMKRLYFDFALQNKGVSMEDYKGKLEAVSGLDLDQFYASFVNGSQPFESILTEALEYLGFELLHKAHTLPSHGKLGFKYIQSPGGKALISSIYPGSPADLGGMMPDDEIIALNGISVGMDIDRWIEYYNDDPKEFTVMRKLEVLTMTLPEVNRHFFLEYDVQNLKEINARQNKARNAWMS